MAAQWKQEPNKTLSVETTATHGLAVCYDTSSTAWSIYYSNNLKKLIRTVIGVIVNQSIALE